ncbi:SCO7613 C-terminal domain-containing membrane protein [Actinocorallia longicatena]|uniref:DUF2157 domain-containing protein n=1 Tax=Actinocorallia longicatena TaxID=111803 RepID=A0ABP6Q9W7_9ACTN
MPDACAVCHLPLAGDLANELWELDTRLFSARIEMDRLLERRSRLMYELRRSVAPPEYREPARDLDGLGVRNLLLALGAGLLGIAALVFTVVSWGHLGLTAKGAVLTSLAAVALYLPWPLAGRRLGATAEAVGVVGLLLTVLECYAAYSYGVFGEVDARWYTAGAATLFTAGTALYARFGPLAAPRIVAVLSAQLPVPLAAFALHATALEFAASLLLTSALGLAALARSTGGRVVRTTGAVTGLAGLVVALGAGALALAGNGGTPDVAACLRASAGIALGCAVAFPAAATAGDEGGGACFAAAGVLVIAAGRAVPPRFRTGLWTAGAPLLLLPAVWAAVDAAAAIAGQAAPHGQSPVILLLLASVLFALRRPVAGTAFTALAATALPVLAGLPLPWALTAQLSLTACLLALAVLREAPDARLEDRGLTLLGLAAAAVAVGWALDERLATVVALSIVFLLCTAVAVRTRTNAIAALSAVISSGLLCGAVAALNGWAAPAEVYTVPVTLGGLLLGRLWRGRLASSWTAYGPALAITFVPSLVLVWDQAGWQRPLVLGAAALAATLIGLRYRRQAPALIGGVVLVLDAVHELAPRLVQLAGLLPRWAPIAAAGLLLLALGATYERRLGDVRRLHGRFASMH